LSPAGIGAGWLVGQVEALDPPGDAPGPAVDGTDGDAGTALVCGEPFAGSPPEKLG
jgi:hypothetical protein